jgi:chromosome partitioning protein
MAKILAITNQKGGVGKTTTSVNLSASLVATRRRVLLIDLDPQGNATMGSGINKHGLEQTVCDVLLGEAAAGDVIVPSEQAGYDLLPANADLTVAEVTLMSEVQSEKRLQKALEPVLDQYDYILIDCPPSLNMLTVNALVAANGVIIPMQCEYYALEGLSALLDTIEQIRSTLNFDLSVEGLLRTMFDPRNNLANDVSAQLVEHFGDRVYRTVVPRNIRLAEAPSHGLPALVYDKRSQGAMAYLALAGEMLRRETGGAMTAEAAV